MQKAVALNRFGLGMRPGDSVPDDPRAWLKRQMSQFDPKPQVFAGLPSRAQIAQSLADYLEEVRDFGRTPKPAASMAAAAEGDEGPERKIRQMVREGAREHYVAQVGARARAALVSDTPFIERLVHFWSNHFAVSIDKLSTIGMGGMLEIETVRPHVLGRFEDLLLAIEQHPAMLLYLDQAQSIGPQSMIASRIAQRRPDGRPPGLNENLAREILELHTLGVRTGYSQADVTELANALTGWTVAGISRGPAARLIGDRVAPGQFVFVPALHQPGSRTILGRRYAQAGEDQGRAILQDLAAHPATAQNIATKLARHFAGDEPPASLINRLVAAFRISGGDLPTVYAALIDAPDIWNNPAPKFKTPWEWTISSLRALGSDGLPDLMMTGIMNELGQPVWKPGSPAGFDDVAQSWAGSDALVKRVEVAERMATRMGTGIDARTLAPRLLAGALSTATREAIERAATPSQALALFLVSPEFLRR
jgi:uncharacterized protein (DUF1800 family)